jgi:phosphoribosylaminoimidazole-succinocarboxamide synthase
LLKLVYEGSVKRLLERADNPKRLYFQFTDDFSVFDWGKMPDTIAKKGLSLALMGAYFFETLSTPGTFERLKTSPHLNGLNQDFLNELFQSKEYISLCDRGLAHHYFGLNDGEKTFALSDLLQAKIPQNIYLEVAKASVFAPSSKNFGANRIYFYPEKIESPLKKRLIPLEVVFRFGMPQGSSLKGRLEKNPDYMRELGLKTMPSEGDLFEIPVIEFFTKLEPEDRHLSYQEAVLLARLNQNQFEALLATTRALALALRHIFGEHEIALFDGKFEFLLDQEKDIILLADSIGPDELRLIYRGHHLSKELVRQYYQDSKWATAVKEAKRLSKIDPSTDFKERCINELNETPEPIKADKKCLIDLLYPVLASTLTGKNLLDSKEPISLAELAKRFDHAFKRTVAR